MNELLRRLLSAWCLCAASGSARQLYLGTCSTDFDLRCGAGTTAAALRAGILSAPCLGRSAINRSGLNGQHTLGAATAPLPQRSLTAQALASTVSLVEATFLINVAFMALFVFATPGL